MAASPADAAALLAAFIRDERLPPAFAALAERLHQPLAARIAAWSEAARSGQPLVVGVCGPQGSGKSTLALLLARLLNARGLRTANLSIDDLYLPRAARERLARDVHPLLRTRGVPGTHDPTLGLTVLDALARPGPTPLPRFDKAADDRAPQADWPIFEGPADVVLLEGWCVGARPEPSADLAAPINALEAAEDPDGAWRAFANDALAGPYRPLFARLDRLVLLTAPDFATVRAWRGEQEAKLRARLTAQGRDAAQTMDDAALDRFLAHYQRLTEWIAHDLSNNADVAVRLDAHRWPVETRGL
jgi:D-glycerate 3-kinase